MADKKTNEIIEEQRRARQEFLNLKKISGRITLFGALFLAIIALVPSIIFKAIDPTSYNVFTATSMLIVVSVAIEFNTALQSQIMMKNYKGFLK